MPSKTRLAKMRYVAATQSLLVLCTVGAALVPAATLVTLDVVRQAPTASNGVAPQPTGALAAYTKAALTPSTVDVAPVAPHVHEIAMTTSASATALPKGVAGGGAGGAGKTAAHAAEGMAPVAKPTKAAVETHPAALSTTITSTPQPVTGYGVVGLTWAHGDNIPMSKIKAAIRTEKNGVWTKWTELDYDDDGPDANSTEGKRERPGTIEGLVGHVNEVQGRITVTGAAVPSSLELAVIDPGEPAKTAQETPAIDTGRIDSGAATPDTEVAGRPGVVGGVEADAIPVADGGTAPATTPATTPAGTATSTGLANVADTTGTETADANPGNVEQAALAAAAYTPKPQIYSRAQWGADESLRDKSSLHYGEIHGGFVHHTVNANDYTEAEVPGIIRSIYAYHVESRGWSDIGYNFLIDKFGRIWEGRYGGVDRPVVGAHTENYNEDGFGVSAIGNYQIAQPSNALIQAEGALFAWKLSLEGISAAAKNVTIGPRTFISSIMGHRDTKATECPGQYLYAKIPEIRQLAAGLQKGWAGRQLQHNVAGAAYPDLIVRRASDKMGYVIPTGGLVGFNAPVVANKNVGAGAAAFVSPDLTGDGVADVVESFKNGTVAVVPGHGNGSVGGAWATSPASLFAGTTLLTAAGDLNGDGHNDLVARNSATGLPVVFFGDGRGHFTRRALTSGPSLAGKNLLTATGDVTGDGHADLIARDTTGHLWIYPGDGKGGFAAPRAVAGAWGQYTAITGFGDYTGDGRPDLIVRTANGVTAIRAGSGTGFEQLTTGSFTQTASYGSVIGGAQMVGSKASDLLVRSGSTISVLPNSGRYNLGSPIATGINLATATKILNVGDWNGDGYGDLVVRRTDGDLYLYLGKGNGTFAAPTLLATGFGKVTGLAAVGDVTGDGVPDLQGRVNGNGSIYIWPGLRNPSRLGAGYFSHNGVGGYQIAAGTWTADGAPDSMYLRGSTLTLYPGDGPGGLTAGAQRVLSTSFTAYQPAWVLGVGPIAAGSNTPALVARNAKGQLFALVRSSTYGLSAPVFLGNGLTGYDMVG